MLELWSHLLFYLGLGGLLTLEEAGVFLLPGDISLIGAGVYASQGSSLIFVSWAVSSLGMVIGSSFLFFSVRRSETSTRALPDRVRHLVHRYGAWGVGAARMVPGLRNATVLAAAAACLSPYKFFLGLVPAAMAWSAFLLLLGWFGGDAFLGLYGRIEGKPVVKTVSIGLVLCGALFVAYRLHATRRQEAADAQ